MVEIKEYKTCVLESKKKGSSSKGKIATERVVPDDKNYCSGVNSTLPGSYPRNATQNIKNDIRIGDISCKPGGLPGSYPVSNQVHCYIPSQGLRTEINKASLSTKDHVIRKCVNGKYMPIHDLN